LLSMFWSEAIPKEATAQAISSISYLLFQGTFDEGIQAVQ